MTQDEFLALARGGGYAPAVLVERDGAYRLEVHDHPFDAFALVLEGDFTLEIEGQATAYPAGTTFRLPARTPHREWAGPQGVRYLAARKEQPQS